MYYMHIENSKHVHLFLPFNSSELPMRSQQYRHEGPAKSIETKS